MLVGDLKLTVFYVNMKRRLGIAPGSLVSFFLMTQMAKGKLKQTLNCSALVTARMFQTSLKKTFIMIHLETLCMYESSKVFSASVT